MCNNLMIIGNVLNYIEDHLLEEELNLDGISLEIGYSKYHLHRMFSSIVGFSLHTYIQRRRLTEALRMLVYTDKPIVEIALCAGYDSQRSFSRVVKKVFRHSPGYLRKKKDFLPLQMKYDIHNQTKLRGDRILDIKIVEKACIKLIGYQGNTQKGFHVIGKCWHMLHKHKNELSGWIDKDYLIGVNDYTDYAFMDDQPTFTYFAGAEVEDVKQIPKGMKTMVLPASRYVVFYFRGHNEDSLQSVVEYIYQEWFANAACRLDEDHCYDFAKYGEIVDDKGMSDIQFWVPIAE